MIHPSIQSLLDEIDNFCVRADISPSAFGRAALKDPNFVGDLRAGRSPNLKLIDRVRGYIAAHDTNDAPATAPPGKPGTNYPQKSSRRCT